MNRSLGLDSPSKTRVGVTTEQLMQGGVGGQSYALNRELPHCFRRR